MDSNLDKKNAIDLSGQAITRQFDEIVDIILSHRSRASRAVNNELLMTAWQVGGYVSAKLKSEEWGSKIVTQLSEYIRSRRPDIKGYSRQNIYNMVMFYEEYSSPEFAQTVIRFLNPKFVQSKSAQLMIDSVDTSKSIVQEESGQIVQTMSGQLPKILEMTTLSNHQEILSRCKGQEERMFYILYANREHLTYRELKRCISNQTFSTLLGSKKSMSKGMIEAYPTAPAMFKDTLFVDFLNLPRKHSEKN